ncbi:MAG: AAA family ATPase [bacterium]
METKLIILRGPSGSGKSTVAKRLKDSSSRNIATIEQDMFRHNILHDQENAREISAIMMKDAIVSALSNGYDVIADGIFDISHSKKLFDEILDEHQDNNYIYYFNISFNETLARHDTRRKKNDFSEEEMKKWYMSPSPSGYDFEVEISENMSEDETVAMIKKDVGY